MPPDDVGASGERLEPGGGATPAKHLMEKHGPIVAEFDRFMHCSDPPETHSPDLHVREFLANEAGDLGVRSDEIAPVSFGTNLFRRDLVVGVAEERALEDSDFGRHAIGRLEVRRTEYLLDIVSDVAVAFQTLNPVLAGRAVGGNREGNDVVFLAP